MDGRNKAMLMLSKTKGNSFDKEVASYKTFCRLSKSQANQSYRFAANYNKLPENS